jgi:hypothetical protein
VINTAGGAYVTEQLSFKGVSGKDFKKRFACVFEVVFLYFSNQSLLICWDLLQ